MAYHFSANQFEDQYNARKLGNWEYPKWFPERPRQRTKPTKIIADDNGHLLSGIRRENPWGTYVGTWDLPKRITREFAEKLAAPPAKAFQVGHCSKAPEKKAEEGRAVEEQGPQPEVTRCKLCCKPPEKCLCQESNLSECSSADEVLKCADSSTAPKLEAAVCTAVEDQQCTC